jgi:hypothetical protein
MPSSVASGTLCSIVDEAMYTLKTSSFSVSSVLNISGQESVGWGYGEVVIQVATCDVRNSSLKATETL